jgi:hypothetical protein
MIRKKAIKICLFIILCTCYNVYANDPHINLNQQKESGVNLIKLWESINYASDFVIDPYQINTWELKFVNEYSIALKKNDIDLAFKLSIPLSYIYHSETKFKKGLPLLQNIYKNKNKLNKDQLKDVLIKLEEEYRAINNI